LAHRFAEKNGSIICRELLGLSVKREEPVPAERTAEYYKMRPCPELAGCADAQEYIKMYSQKTGALIRGAFRAGAICATEGDDLEDLLSKFAECISEGIEPKSDVLDSGKMDVEGIVNTVTEYAGHVGLAYQIADDLIDGDKSIVDVVGKEEAQSMLKDHLNQAVECAGKLASADELVEFAKELCVREK
ncbi:MAG: polyprenyl synthetase family protein, partial [Clostridia bacterium]|nr:polyprenyl synthetase family protein [Clostridia bacterium]